MNERCDGFTLVEVMIALVLILIVLLSAAPMFVYASQINSAGAEIGSATALAEERMELLRQEVFNNLPDGGDLRNNVAGYSDTSSDGFEVRWRITDSAGMKRIEVRAVSLSQAPGPTKEASLTFLRARG